MLSLSISRFTVFGLKVKNNKNKKNLLNNRARVARSALDLSKAVYNRYVLGSNPSDGKSVTVKNEGPKNLAKYRY